jgi:glycosyltransferase involved in cell wall biosynthesis
MSRQLPEPAVTVVMPFLDCAAFLDEAIRSVRTQRLVEWELLLVDDGSSDGSSRIAAAHAADDPERIRVLSHAGGGNRGLRAARGLGIATARGRYIAFLDGDDVYEPGRLERHVELLDAQPELVAVQGLVRYWREWLPTAAEVDSTEPPPLGVIEGIVRSPGLLVLLLGSHGASAAAITAVTAQTAVLRRAAAPTSDEPSQMYEDQALLTRLYLAGSVRVIAECHARYRQHPASMTRTVPAAEQIAARRRFLHWLRGLPETAALPVLAPLIDAELGHCRVEAGAGTPMRSRIVHSARRIAPPALLRWRGRRKLAARTAANLRIVARYLKPDDSSES